MEIDQVIEEFYSMLPSLTNGLWKQTQYLSADEYDDCCQEAAISLYKYGKKYTIDDTKLRGLFYITLKNKTLVAIEKKKKQDEQFNPNYDTNEDKDEQGLHQNQHMEDKSNIDLNEEYREILLGYITQEEYDDMVDYYDSPNKLSKIKIRNRINRLRYDLGLNISYDLYVYETDETVNFKYKGDACEYIGLSKGEMSRKTKNGTTFTFNKKKYTIRKVIKFTNK